MSIKNKKILVDCSNIFGGGAIQVAVSFIRNAVLDNSIDYYYILSDKLVEQIDIPEERVLLVCCSSSAKSPILRKSILKIESELNVDLVFSLFGPTFIKYKSKHVVGFANGWVSHAKIHDYIHCFGTSFELIYKLIRSLLIGFYIRSRNNVIFESQFALSQFCKRFFYNNNNAYLVKNTYPDVFDNDNDNDNDNEFKFSEKYVLILSAYYKHKNIESIPYVAKELMKLGESFKFILTLDDKSFNEEIKPHILKFDQEECIINIGPVKIDDLPSLYKSVDIVYSPSRLETSSAVGFESMRMNKKLVLNDKEFFRDQCGSNAVYVDSEDVNQVARTLIDVYKSSSQENLTVGQYSSKDKYLEYQKVFKAIIEGK